MDPFLEGPGKFSRPKSHIKNHAALDLQIFLFQQVLLLDKVYTYETVSKLRIFLLFSYGLLKLSFRARQLSGTFENRASGLMWSAFTVIEAKCVLYLYILFKCLGWITKRGKPYSST